MQPELRGYANGILDEASITGEVAHIAQELRAVAELVATNPPLSVALTDTAVPLPARASVVSELLASRVSPRTLRVVLRAVRLEAPQELLPGLHDVAELARLWSERPDEVDYEEPAFGRGSERRLLSGYAAAALEGLDSVEEIEEVEDELFRFARVVEASPNLRHFLAERSVPVKARQQVVDDLLAAKARPVTLRLARESLRGRVRDVVGVLDWLVELAAEARGWRVARVRSAAELDESSRAALSASMQHLTGKPVELQVTLDESLLGGVVVVVGDVLVDASARHRLAQIEEKLVGDKEFSPFERPRRHSA